VTDSDPLTEPGLYAARPGYLLKRAQSLLNEAMAAALAPSQLSVAQFAALNALAEAPGASNADLARTAFVSPPTMHALLRHLEDTALVARKPHPHHGRILRATLTPTGHRTLAAARRAVAAVEAEMLDGLSPARRSALATTLAQCIANLASEPSSSAGQVETPTNA